ncbi:MAG TPA: polymer-forming cytoskeletal protein [Chloroflexota bacterium]|nr:polymer-forming cytoskeletal protein [Chloroflexota bacterium]
MTIFRRGETETRSAPPEGAPASEPPEASAPAEPPGVSDSQALAVPGGSAPSLPAPAHRTGTVLAAGTVIEGTLRADEPVRVGGTLQGTLEAAGPVLVEAGGKLIARVVAPEIVVAGYVDGRLQCQGRLEVRASGLVRGKMQVGALRIEEGALLDGQLQMHGAALLPPAAEVPALSEPARPRGRAAARLPEPSADPAPEREAPVSAE